MGQSYEPKAPPHLSPDGQWWWNGYRWIPSYDAPASVRSALAPSPKGERTGRGIHLGGTAEARFQKRFTAVRRVAGLVGVLTFAGAVVGEASHVPTWPVIALILLVCALSVLVSVARLITISTDRNITIAASAQTVFDEIADPEAWGWGGSKLGRYLGVREREDLPGGGTRGRLAAKSLGLPAELTWDTLKYEPPARLLFVGRVTRFGLPVMIQLSDWSLTEAGDDTEVHYHLECQVLGMPFTPTQIAADRLTDRTMAALTKSIEGRTRSRPGG